MTPVDAARNVYAVCMQRWRRFGVSSVCFRSQVTSLLQRNQTRYFHTQSDKTCSGCNDALPATVREDNKYCRWAADILTGWLKVRCTVQHLYYDSKGVESCVNSLFFLLIICRWIWKSAYTAHNSLLMNKQMNERMKSLTSSALILNVKSHEVILHSSSLFSVLVR
jgi:hypothetical protein